MALGVIMWLSSYENCNCVVIGRRLPKRPNARLTTLASATSQSRCIRRSCSSRSPTWPTSTRCTSTRCRGSSTCSCCRSATPSAPQSSWRDWRTCRSTSPTCCTATSAGRCSKRTRYSTNEQTSRRRSSLVRTLVFPRWTLPGLRPICGWQGKVPHLCQSANSTQPFIPLCVLIHVIAWITRVDTFIFQTGAACEFMAAVSKVHVCVGMACSLGWTLAPVCDTAAPLQSSSLTCCAI